MRKVMFSVIASLAIASCAFAQPQTPDERVRTSTVAPDLSNSAGGWQVVPEQEKLVYHNQDSTVNLKMEFYVNTKEHLAAFLYVLDYVVETKRYRQEFAMLYGTAKVARGAIKASDGAWYVSREMFFDNDKENTEGAVSMEVVFDEAKRPVKAKLSLETVDGPKVVVLDLQ